MIWETPSFCEVNMSSEIGSYQDDFEERAPLPGDGTLREAAPRPVGRFSAAEE